MNPIIKLNNPISDQEINQHRQEELQNKKTIKKIIPEHLEKKMPKCIILYGEPHIEYDQCDKKNFKINLTYPVTDYYLKEFTEHYKIRKKRPSPQQMFNAMSGDMNNLYNECKNFFNEASGNLENLKNYQK